MASLIDAQLERTLENVPEAGKRDLSFLRVKPSGIRGTILVQLRDVTGAMFLKKSEDADANGIFVSGRDVQVLSEGDRVQLRLIAGIRSSIAVTEATVIRRGRINGILGCVFEFTNIEEGQAQALRDLLFNDSTIARIVERDLLDCQKDSHSGNCNPGDSRTVSSPTAV